MSDEELSARLVDFYGLSRFATELREFGAVDSSLKPPSLLAAIYP